MGFVGRKELFQTFGEGKSLAIVFCLDFLPVVALYFFKVPNTKEPLSHYSVNLVRTQQLKSAV